MERTNFTNWLFAAFVGAMLFWCPNEAQAQCPVGQSELTIQFGSGTFNQEIFWELVHVPTGAVILSEAAGGFSAGATLVNCLDDGPYEFRANDTFGDGWNGASLQITYSEDGSVNGCPNPVPAFGTVMVPSTIPTGAQQVFPLVFGCPDCMIDCPDDVVVSNDPGQCSAFVSIPEPTTTGDCAGGFSASACSNFSATTAGGPGNTTVVDIMGPFPAPDASVLDVTFAITAEGDLGFTTEDFDVFDEDGNFIFTTPQVADCSGPFPAFNYTVSLAQFNTWAADGMITFTFDPVSTAINPNLCGTNEACVSFSYATPPQAINDFNGTTNASGLYPVGTTTVTYIIFDALTGLPVTCSFDVTVNDDEAPDLSCPGDFTVALGPGECERVVDYDVSVTDNCPFFGPNTQLFSHDPFPPTTFFNGFSGVTFDVTNMSADPLELRSFTTSLCPGNHNVSVYYTTTASTNVGNQTNAAAWTLMGTVAVTGAVCGSFADQADIDVGGLVLQPGQSKGIYIMTDINGLALRYTNGATANDDGSLLIESNGFAGAPNFSNTFFPRGFVGSVNYGVTLDGPPLTQTEGLPSGSLFPIGQVQNCFESEDLAGNMSDCCFTITVTEFPNAINFPVCNDLVQASLDENCEVEITADMILEGGPYGCYDEYIVQIENQIGHIVATSSGVVNGPGAIVGAAAIGQTWIVRVTDPDNNNNNCWGQLIVEDKLPPELLCRDITIACTAELPDSPAPEANGSFEYAIQPGVAIVSNAPTITETIPVDLPAGGQILDINVKVDITHTWIGDLSVDIETPGGDTWVFWPVGLCATQDDINFVADDEGAVVTFCNEIQDGSNIDWSTSTGGAVQPLSNLDGLDPAGDWLVNVADNVGGDDGTLNEVILFIEVGGITQVDPVDACDGDNIDLTVQGTFEDGGCSEASRIWTRTWTATDQSGNSVSCNQVITIARPALEDVELPENIMWTCQQYHYFPNITEATRVHPFITDTDPADEIINVNLDPLSDDDDLPFPQSPCFPFGEDDPNINSTNVANGGQGSPGNNCFVAPPNNGLDDADVLLLSGSGRPSVEGLPMFNGDLCGISMEYDDVLINECPGTFKILRTWTLIDWCADPVATLEHNQVIKVVDIDGPELTVPNDLTIDVYEGSGQTQGPHAICTGHVVVPPATSAGDLCGTVTGWVTEIMNGDIVLGSIQSNGGIFWDIPLLENGVNAQYTVRYVVRDGCDNETIETIDITVRDRVPPVSICDEITEVSVTNNGATGAGCSTVYAETLDDGSYDNCKPVHFLLAKMDDSFSQDIFNRCYYPTRQFCCEDVGEDVQVILLVLDGDPSPFFTTLNSPSLGCDGTPGLFLTSGFSAINYNTCMVTVGVTDKLQPIVTSCPGAVDITCDFYNDNLATALELGDYSVLDQFGTPTFFDNCAVNINPTVNDGVDQCGQGNITRTWQATDDAGNGPATCTQIVRVHHISDWVVQFPADLTVECGNNVPDFGEPEIFFETCELLAVSYEDQLFDIVPDACYKIVRHWTVINWCVVGDDIDQEVIEVPESQYPFLCNDIDGDGIPWEPRVYRDSWTGGPCGDPIAQPGINQGLSGLNLPPDTDLDLDPWDGYIEYQQIIKVRDQVAPDFADGCDIPDVCIEDNTCGATVVLPTPDVLDCSDGVEVSVTSDLGNGFGPFFNVSPGTYTVTYSAEDNCGNSNSCQTTVTVLDCKLPTPYCKNGLVIELMPATGCVDIWASDFNAGSFDNCPGALKLSFSADVNDTGDTYCCDQVGQQLVQLWVTDAAGNQDYCETFVIIQDNMGACGGDPQIAGLIETEDNEGVDGVDVTVNSSNASFDATIATQNGQFNFAQVPAGGDYTVTPLKDINPLNGVSTFDLVLISKHILGVQTLDSPYKIIAADANNSGTVTTFDMVAVRKLILFVEDQFPNNTSWRFVDKAHNFVDATNPWATNFNEVISLNNVTEDMLNNDFVGIKVGDVNGSADPVLFAGTDDRTATETLTFSTDDRSVKAGETFTVDFTANNFNHMGYQFTLNFDRSALEFVGVDAGLAKADNFGLSLLDEGVITTSWNSNTAKQLTAEEAVFSMTFTAKTDAQLSDLLSINSRYTVAEAYTNSELNDVAIEFNGTTVAAGFELYQNTPNPFEGSTVISFNLPEATSATLTITDVSGKVLKVVEGDFSRGYNQVTVSELAGTGVLYYQLDTPNDTATKKMILID